MSYAIVTYPNNFLRQNSAEVSKFNRELEKFGQLLIEAMREKDGVGLAAIQIGEPRKIIAIKTESGPKVFVNTKIHWRSQETETDLEGCLSVPGVFGTVIRPKKIKLSVQDVYGKTFKLTPTGFLARVFQHEIDHTHGVLFIDKVQKIVEAPEGFTLPGGEKVTLFKQGGKRENVVI